MRLHHFATAVCSLCFASPAVASEWWLTGLAGDGPSDRFVEFVDKESATTDSRRRVLAWSFKIYERLQEGGTRKSKNLFWYDCTSRTMALVASSHFGNNDRHIQSFTYKPYEQEQNYVAPDSMGEAKWLFFCKGEAPYGSPIPISPEEFAAELFRRL